MSSGLQLHIDITVADERWPARKALRTLVLRSVKSASAAAGLVGQGKCELSLLFTNDEAMATINRDWRGIDKATNVLSFPGSDVSPGEAAGPVLGDIVVAFETVEREARLEDKAFEHHLSHLIIHGFLHLFGYDHLNEKEAAEMESLEAEALAQLGIVNPYA